MNDTHDYTKQRKLATIEHMGVTFHVSRKYRNGKPSKTGGYILHYNGEHMASLCGDTAEEAAQHATELFAKTFPAGSEEKFKKEFTTQRARVRGWAD